MYVYVYIIIKYCVYIYIYDHDILYTVYIYDIFTCAIFQMHLQVQLSLLVKDGLQKKRDGTRWGAGPVSEIVWK